MVIQYGSFPNTRMRRLRQQGWLHDLVAEHSLQVNDLIWPLFVQEGLGEETPVESLPGVSRLSIDRLVVAAKEAHDLGIPAIALFPVTPDSLKNAQGGEALNPENLVCRAIAAVKVAVPELGVIADVALDPYTDHGHDGLVEGGDVANDATVEVLCQQAITLAQAGADVVAPSDMMDGRVGAIRAALDAQGHDNVAILSYAAKYASAFYGPFRDAVGSGRSLGKKGKWHYQMNPANGDEALREVALDIAEGADMVMVKPGLPYLDVVRNVAHSFPGTPVMAYQVSGEYAMLHAAAKNGALDAERAMAETLLAFKRAGARGIFTYAAREIAVSMHP